VRLSWPNPLTRGGFGQTGPRIAPHWTDTRQTIDQSSVQSEPLPALDKVAECRSQLPTGHSHPLSRLMASRPRRNLAQKHFGQDRGPSVPRCLSGGLISRSLSEPVTSSRRSWEAKRPQSGIRQVSSQHSGVSPRFTPRQMSKFLPWYSSQVCHLYDVPASPLVQITDAAKGPRAHTMSPPLQG
jgi:hypothetical protein